MFYTGECRPAPAAFIIILANAGMCEKPTVVACVCIVLGLELS